MKFLHLVVANLGRHKRRTILTIASVALALFLYATLRSVVTTIDATAQLGNARRLVTNNATGITFALPLSYANRIQAVPGVEAVTFANWFGGRYGDGKRFFAQFAIDPESYLSMYPESGLPEDQKQAFLHERSAAIVGNRLLDVFGWKLGQDVTIQGTIYPGDWTFTIRGVYTPTDKTFPDDAFLFHHDFLEERTGRPGLAGWYVMRIDRPDNAARIARIIDDQFRNSRDATKTGTEQAFNASFATMWGNVSLLMGTIGMAVVFAILLVTANAMMMSARERTAEVGVLKTIGFTDGTLFGLVMLEAGLITITGAIIGLGGARWLYQSTNFNGGGALPGFRVTNSTLAIGFGIALLLMLASGLVPAIRAAKLPVVQALRRVE
ncbi:MAG: FtsX-like permease family protein [Gemmatimonadota bacterium]